MPMVPIVAIAVPAEVAPELAATVQRTCNLALGFGHCALRDAAQPATSASWLAYVGIDAAQPNLLRIELRDALPRHTRTTYSRWLTFEDSDPPAHRWSTVGVVVAALVISAQAGKAANPADAGESSTDARAGAVEPEDASVRPSVAAPLPTKNQNGSPDGVGGSIEASRAKAANSIPQRELRLDLGALAGSGIEGHAWRYGFALRPSFTIGSRVALCSQLAGARASDSLFVSFWSGAAGLAWVTELFPRWLTIEARVLLFGDRLEFRITDAAGASDAATRWRYGVGAGLDAVLPLWDPVGWFVAMDGSVANPPVKIRQAGVDVGATPTVDTLITSGLRWRIPLER